MCLGCSCEWRQVWVAVVQGCMGHTRLCGSCGRLHCMAVTVVQSGSIGNVRKAKMGGSHCIASVCHSQEG